MPEDHPRRGVPSEDRAGEKVVEFLTTHVFGPEPAVTLAKLQAGVLAANDFDTRAQRLATLDTLADIEVLPVDEDAARMWARMRIHLAESGRRVWINDLWIAAIAAARGLPIVTQDDDFNPIDGVAGLSVIKV